MEQQKAALEEQVEVSRAEVLRLETAYARAQDEIATLQDQVGHDCLQTCVAHMMVT